jgi:peptidoglycan LD-endopeptidase CwlK
MLSEKSLARLAGVDPRLQTVIAAAAAICPTPFVVTEGLRSKARQEMLFAAGKSKTLNSRHLTGEAVDVACVIEGVARWEWAYYESIAKAVKAAARQLGVDVEWGGDWATFKDGVHFQLSPTRSTKK